MSAWRSAFSLSKAEANEAKPPGTAIIIRKTSMFKHQGMKLTKLGEHERHGDLSYELVRVPHPSDDPADPLNWPLWRKTSVLLVSSLFAFTGTFLSNSPASALQLLYHGFVPPTRPFADLTYFISVCISSGRTP